MASDYLNESARRSFCGKCEAGIEHSADECKVPKAAKEGGL